MKWFGESLAVAGQVTIMFAICQHLIQYLNTNVYGSHLKSNVYGSHLNANALKIYSNQSIIFKIYHLCSKIK